MSLARDLREFIASLNSSGVEYLVIGAYAVAFHARPRFTEDFDVVIRPTPENARRMMAALAAFGFVLKDLSEADFQKPGFVVQLGRKPLRIDILTSISGVDTETLWANRVAAHLEGLPVYFPSREDLLRNKRAAARDRDLIDAHSIEEFSEGSSDH